MTQDEIRSLFAYNSWANHRVLEACAVLSPAQLKQSAAGSFPTLYDTLHHIMGVEWLYLERFHGRSPVELLPGESFDTIAAFSARWEPIRKGLEEFIRGAELGDPERVFEYTNMKGRRCRYNLRSVLQHVVNHSTYHRGQVTTQLRALGAKPLSTDLLRYYDHLAGLPVD